MANSKKTKSAKKNEQTATSIADFRVVVEEAPVMLWLTNTAGEIIFSNSRWKQFIGVDPNKHLGGNAWYEALHADDKEHCLGVFRTAFVSHQQFEMEYRLRRSDGQYRHIYDRGEPYIDHDGVFSGFIGSSADITEQKNSENQLRRSQRELTRYNNEMQLINELNSYLQVCQTFEETYAIVGHYANKLFAGSTGALYLLNEDRSALEAVTYWGEAETKLELVIATDDCWALRQSRTHIFNKGESDKIKCKHVLNTPEYGCICTPAIAQGEVIGFLCLEFSANADSATEAGQSEKFLYSSTESQTRIATITADNLAMALVSLKLREALRSQSVRDPLTRLYNRRYMEETLTREIARCKRSELKLGLMMIDVDHFKTYNDEYGHEVGDRVLCELADLMQLKLRDSDVACRYGGEEFILIMPGAENEIVHKRAEHIRQVIESHEINHKGNVLTEITVSIGIACYPEHGEANEDLIKRADTALYSAKETGRNKVVLAA